MARSHEGTAPLNPAGITEHRECGYCADASRDRSLARLLGQLDEIGDAPDEAHELSVTDNYMKATLVLRLLFREIKGTLKTKTNHCSKWNPTSYTLNLMVSPRFGLFLFNHSLFT